MEIKITNNKIGKCEFQVNAKFSPWDCVMLIARLETYIERIIDTMEVTAEGFTREEIETEIEEVKTLMRERKEDDLEIYGVRFDNE